MEIKTKDLLNELKQRQCIPEIEKLLKEMKKTPFKISYIWRDVETKFYSNGLYAQNISSYEKIKTDLNTNIKTTLDFRVFDPKWGYWIKPSIINYDEINLPEKTNNNFQEYEKCLKQSERSDGFKVITTKYFNKQKFEDETKEMLFWTKLYSILEGKEFHNFFK